MSERDLSKSECQKRQDQVKQERNGTTSTIHRCTHRQCDKFTKKVTLDVCEACPLRVPLDKPKPTVQNLEGPTVMEDGSLVYQRMSWLPPPPHPGYIRKSNQLDSDDAWIFIPEGELVGPGSQLHRMLASIGIHPTAGCQCRTRMKAMDDNGPAWCREHIEEIIDWMQEEAKARSLPFLRIIARRMVQRAIRKSEIALAEKAAAKAARAA